jgi:hypothetical protein
MASFVGRLPIVGGPLRAAVLRGQAAGTQLMRGMSGQMPFGQAVAGAPRAAVLGKTQGTQWDE